VGEEGNAGIVEPVGVDGTAGRGAGEGGESDLKDGEDHELEVGLVETVAPTDARRLCPREYWSDCAGGEGGGGSAPAGGGLVGGLSESLNALRMRVGAGAGAGVGGIAVTVAVATDGGRGCAFKAIVNVGSSISSTMG
jgi:hypothetical protein